MVPPVPQSLLGSRPALAAPSVGHPLRRVVWPVRFASIAGPPHRLLTGASPAGDGLVSQGGGVIELRILGSLQLSTSDGRDLEALARQSKRTALLVYLAAAVPNGLHRRDTLLALFWPELDEARGRAALSQTLYVLRNALGDQAIVTRGDDEVGLSNDAVWCDARAFEAALDAGQSGEALALYRGDLLSGFSLSDAPDFGHWLDRERDRLRERAAEGAWACANARAAERDVVQAVHWARWAAALAPTDEAVIRRLMTFLRGQGDRAAALRAYEAFASTLTREYELEPSAETRALVEAMRLEHPLATGPIEHLAPSAPSVRQEAPPTRRSGLIGMVIGAALLTILGLRVIVPHGGGGTPAPAIRRIAVLPLQNLMRDSTQDYFVDGMHEALIGELAKIEAVRVISRTSVLRFRGPGRPSLPHIARQLGVDAVVEGSVLRAGDSVRVAIQLIDGRTDQHLWSETYLRNLHDVLRLYGELASDVAGQIRVAVTSAERDRLVSARQVDPEVYGLALKGQYQCWLWTDAGFDQGIRWLRAAIDSDPTYAPAYARLAICYSDRTMFGFAPPAESNRLALVAARRALELDSTLGEAHATLGWMRFVADLDFEGPAGDFHRALDLAPGSALIKSYYADYLTASGRFDDAIHLRRQAIALDPLSAPISLGLGWDYLWARRYDEAIAQYRQTLNLDPGYSIAQRQLSMAYALQQREEVAVAQCDSLIANATLLESVDCGWVYGRVGRRQQVLEIIRRLRTESSRRWVDPVEVATLYASLGDRDRAIVWLRKAARERSQSLVFLKTNPFLDSMRSDPRFQALLRELGITS